MVVRIKGSGVTANPRVRKIGAVIYTSENWAEQLTAVCEDDGGTVPDPDLLLDVSDYFRRNAMFDGRMKLWAPAIGHKAASDRLERLYGIGGEHMQGVILNGGQKPLVTDDANGHRVFVPELSGTRVGGIAATENDVYLAANTNDVWAVGASFNPASTLTAQLAFGNTPGPNTEKGHIPAALTRNGLQTLITFIAQESAYNPNAAATTAPRMTANTTNGTYSGLVGIALAGRISTGEIKVIVDGDVIYEETSGDGALFNYSTFANKLRAGGAYDASLNITSNRKAEFRLLFSMLRSARAGADGWGEVEDFTRQITKWFPAATP